MLIDWNRVSELKDEIGSDDFDEIVEIFLEEVELELGKLRGEPDPETLEDQLHFLKGSALNLGFSEFSGLCQDGETRAANDEHEHVDLQKILSAYDLSKAEFLNSLLEKTAV